MEKKATYRPATLVSRSATNYANAAGTAIYCNAIVGHAAHFDMICRTCDCKPRQIIIIMQRLTRHVSVIRLTNRRLYF